MDHHKVVKEQMLHLFFGAAFVVIIGAFAVGLDLASGFVKRIGVSGFTSQALEFTAHAVMVLDLVLFSVYLIATSVELVKGMLR